MLPISFFPNHIVIKPLFFNVNWLTALLLFVHIPFLSAQLPSGFIRERIATELNPTSMVLAPDGRIFITEKNGVIRIIRDDQLLNDPFLTLEVDDSNERGLGHMVLHPDFEHNGYYYVFYTVPGEHHNRISRFRAIGDFTVPGSEQIILDLDRLGSEVHNGGDLIFGIDGYLYVAVGDGGQNWLGEDLGSTNGKVLRIDDEGHPVADNPWVDLNYLRANYVFAYGFRNPFTMTLHPLTGEIFVNDVGGSNFEEINRLEQGAFYGWPKVEGKRTNQVVPAEYMDPVFQYSHANHYCAIVGSTFYHPVLNQFPEAYTGRYFYSDYCTGHIRMLDPETGMDKGIFINDGDRVIDLDVSADGSLYYLERKGLGDGSPEDNTGTNEGTLWKVSYTGSGAPFISVQPQSVLVSVGEDATFSVLASGAGPLLYTWLLNGEELETTTESALTLREVTLEQDSAIIQVLINNDFGQINSQQCILSVTSNHRPEPMITSPVSGATYKAGNTISFSGLANDEEDGSLTPVSLSWRIDFHHGTHSHPALSWTSGISGGEWLIPGIGETSSEVWYRIYLKATDSEGFSKVVHSDIVPEVGHFEVLSLPQGLIIGLDGTQQVTPYQVEGVRGISRYLSPPYKQVNGDSIYFFKNWMDGAIAINREVKTSDENQTFTGLFDAIRRGQGYGLTASYYDNPNFEGMPVVVSIDSSVDHQYLLKPPITGLPEDYFSIRWKGYIQPYTSGWYQFRVFADDGIFIEIDGNVIIQDWVPGVHNETGVVYLESGRLYPVHIRMYEWLWGAQMRLRWSSDHFPEEVIPSSQLYPEDYLTEKDAIGILSVQTINAETLDVVIESYKDVQLDFSIINASGISIEFPRYWIPVGKNIISFDVSHLSRGLYYLRGLHSKSGEQIITSFVKVK
jgi:glucose/arabinose dehydrogenase